MCKQCEGRFHPWFFVSGGGGSFFHSFIHSSGARVLRARRSIGRSERAVCANDLSQLVRSTHSFDTTHTFDSFIHSS